MKIKLDLSAKQQKLVIQLGMAALVDRMFHGEKKRDTRGGHGLGYGKPWTPTQKKKFVATMAAKRAERERLNGKVATKMTKKWDVKREAKRIEKAARARWTPARRAKYARTLAKQGKVLKKLKTIMHAAIDGRTMRADGKGPLRQPGKAWTPEHRRNFLKGYRKSMKAKRAAMKMSLNGHAPAEAAHASA